MWQVLGVDRDAAQIVDDGLLGLLWRGLGADGNRRSYHALLHAPQPYLQTLLHRILEQVNSFTYEVQRTFLAMRENVKGAPGGTVLLQIIDCMAMMMWQPADLQLVRAIPDVVQRHPDRFDEHHQHSGIRCCRRGRR